MESKIQDHSTPASPNNMPQANILTNHLGHRFNKLAPLLQKTHQGVVNLRGIASVRQGNLIAKFICKIFKFPPPATNIPLHVLCTHTKDGMEWKRDFDGHKMRSHFTQKKDHLVEHLGPLALTIKAEERNGALHYCFIRTHFWGVPLPNFLSPRIKAFEKEANNLYEFSVEVSMFLVGLTIAYNGKLEVEAL